MGRQPTALLTKPVRPVLVRRQDPTRRASDPVSKCGHRCEPRDDVGRGGTARVAPKVAPIRRSSTGALCPSTTKPGFRVVDLSGHHSNPRAPLEALLDGTSCDATVRLEADEDRRVCALGTPGEPIGAAHPRRGRIVDAISRVLWDEGDPMQARDVHARVETLLGEPVRWTSVRATLAGNLKGPAPRFAPATRGRYGVPPPSSPDSIDARPPTRPSRAPKSAWRGSPGKN